MKVLVVVDLQNDFCSGGSLAVPDGEQIISTVNQLLESEIFTLKIATLDYHPADHCSFAANHPGSAPFETIDLNGLKQTLWPTHCVQGTTGAEFHPELKSKSFDFIVAKGIDREVDSYSGFFDNGKRKSTGLFELIKSAADEHAVALKDVELFVCGLATDYCVAFTSLDAAALGLKTSLIIDACRAVNISPGDDLTVLRGLLDKGIEIVESKQLLCSLERPVSRAIQPQP